MNRVLTASLSAAMFVGSSRPAAASEWATLKRYLQAQTQIVSESEDQLVIDHPATVHPIIISDGPCSDCDIYSVQVRRRGSNPYLVWRATPRFLERTDVVKKTWGSVFKTPFLRVLRTQDE